MYPTLAVVQLTDSFSGIWKDLIPGSQVYALGTGVPPVEERFFAIVVSAGGGEEAAIETITTAASEHPGVPISLVGSTHDHRVALSAVRAGAAEYFALPAEHQALRSWIADRRAEATSLLRTDAFIEEQRRAFSFERLIGRSAALRDVLRQAARVIPMGNVPILITGETGTGKELLAQAIHTEGPRAPFPFVELNCAALPANLLEAELFGYEKGAFTDARSAKPGLLESAHRGTIFLDEIGDLPFGLQGKLLKVLEDKRVQRLGSVRQTEVDFRVIAATHVDLNERVAQGTFRADLFYRIDVIPLHLPPLRSRGDDAVVLAEHFAAGVSAEYGIARPSVTHEVRAAILRNPWVGNVRELRHTVLRAMLMGGGTLQADDFAPRGKGVAAALGSDPGPCPPWPATMDQLEEWAAHEALRHCEGNKTQAAELLGIGRNRLKALLRARGDGGQP